MMKVDKRILAVLLIVTLTGLIMKPKKKEMMCGACALPMM
tara:strand:- start:4044 stop:4163 length:120 start_codon:yes stop_codon:yes gene_type:complete